MTNKYMVELFYLLVLKREKTVFHSSEMIEYAQTIVTTANEESVKRALRELVEHHKINVVCIDKANSWYQAFPLKGEYRTLPLDFEQFAELTY